MNILLLGGSGLLGQALCERLLRDGHSVCAVSRRPAQEERPGLRSLACDIASLRQPADWLPLLAGMDVVIYAVGIICEAPGQTFEDLHHAIPAALFAACARADVQRVIHLSALGAEPEAPTAYWRSKALGDAALMATTLDWVIVRPSLVYADAGASSRLFRRLAALPWLVVPADAGVVQPLHLDDLVEMLARLVRPEQPGRRVIPAVGPRALSLAEYLLSLRIAMGMGSATVIRLPSWLATAACRLAGHWGGGLVDSDALAMLRRGCTAEATATQAVLGRAPRAPGQFAHAELRSEAVLAVWLPVCRIALAFVWLYTAAISLSNAPEGLRLLADAGVPERLREAALLSGAGLDAVLGAMTLLAPSRRLWLVQGALTLVYTLFISVFLGHWWLHPFGPISKNVPILAMLGLLASLDKKRSAHQALR